MQRSHTIRVIPIHGVQEGSVQQSTVLRLVPPRETQDGTWSFGRQVVYGFDERRARVYMLCRVGGQSNIVQETALDDVVDGLNVVPGRPGYEVG